MTGTWRTNTTQAVKKQKAFLSKGGGEVDDRKRKYNSMTSSDVSFWSLFVVAVVVATSAAATAVVIVMVVAVSTAVYGVAIQGCSGLCPRSYSLR